MGNWTTVSSPAAVVPPTLPSGGIAMTETGTRTLVGQIGRVQMTRHVAWTSPGTGPEPITAHYSLNVPSGTEGAAGDAPVQTSGSTRFIEFPAWAPTSDQSWSVTIALETSTASSATITSPTVTVNAIADAATGQVTCTAGAVVYTKSADGTWTWSMPITVVVAATDPNLWVVEITRENGHYSGSTWVPDTTCLENINGGIWSCNVPGTYVCQAVSGWGVLPAAAASRVMKFRARTRSRKDGSDTDRMVLQATAWSGAAFLDVTPAVQTGSIDASRFDPATLGATIARDTNGRPIVAPYSLGQSAFAYGALSDPLGGAWNSGAAPVFVNYGLPSYSSYSIGVTMCNTAESPPAFYRNSGYPSGWVKTTSAADITAGNLAATVAILGSVLASKIDCDGPLTVTSSTGGIKIKYAYSSGYVILNLFPGGASGVYYDGASSFTFGASAGSDDSGVLLTSRNGARSAQITTLTPGFFVNGAQVLSTRTATTPTTLPEVIAAMQHHGMVP